MVAARAQTAEIAELVDSLWRSPAALEEALKVDDPEGHAAAIRRALERELRSLDEYQAFLAKVREAGDKRRADLDEEFRELSWRWFRRTIVVVENYHISGNGLVTLIAEDTPPGYLNRIMGLQNIKGTGLDFVDRWCAWESCHRSASQLLDRDPAEAERGLRGLSTFQDFGRLSEEMVRQTLEEVKKASFAQSERIQAELAMIASNLDTAMARIREESGAAATGRGWFASLLEIVEGFLEPGDSVKRRKTADRIYRDVVAERISSTRAEVELKSLTQRQKGGWLARAVEGLRRKLGNGAAPSEPPRLAETRKESVRT